MNTEQIVTANTNSLNPKVITILIKDTNSKVLLLLINKYKIGKQTKKGNIQNSQLKIETNG